MSVGGDSSIYFKGGYKYQVTRDASFVIAIKPKEFIYTEYIRLDTDGTLSIREGYAWDGPSGPTIDTSDSMRGSLIHDALYQLMREGHLSLDLRVVADEILREVCITDGMLKARADAWFIGVRCFADPAADPKSLKPECVAP